MNLDYIKVGVITPDIKVADVDFNEKSIKNGIDQAEKQNVKVIVFPELCLTGSTCGELFCQKTLIEKVKKAIVSIAEYTLGKNLIAFFGAPIENDGLLYNSSVCVSNGVVLGVVPKTKLNEIETKYFSTPKEDLSYLCLPSYEDVVDFGCKVIYCDGDNQNLKIGVEFSEDLDSLNPQSISLVENGARIIVCHSACPIYSGSVEDANFKVKSQSLRLNAGYILANAGRGESTTDYAFSGYNLIVENGEILAKSNLFESDMITAELDLSYIEFLRGKKLKNQTKSQVDGLCYVGFDVDNKNYQTQRTYPKYPFINQGEEQTLLSIQAEGLRKRIVHTNANKLVVGLSGGLDSTLALIVSVKAMELVGKSSKDVLAVTMPCFGTSSRTYDNSIKLAKAFNVPLKKVDIGKSVTRHLKDLKHSEDVHDAAYENAQARERTQVLMDMANMVGGMVVGTGDLSELALGFATYNGDHMSMYSVNGSVPKTLVRHLVNYVAKNNRKAKSVLLDILDTPVSPELLPPKDDNINQVTEDIVGPYTLHDFFLYHYIYKGFTPKKIYNVAVNTFKDEFSSETILKWLKMFFRRFFSQQFKRSCLPDGVKVTNISLSPRGAYNMPSDAVNKIWLDELEEL